MITSAAVFAVAIFTWFSLSSLANSILSHYITYTYQKAERKSNHARHNNPL